MDAILYSCLKSRFLAYTVTDAETLGLPVSDSFESVRGVSLLTGRNRRFVSQRGVGAWVSKTCSGDIGHVSRESPGGIAPTRFACLDHLREVLLRPTVTLTSWSTSTGAERPSRRSGLLILPMILRSYSDDTLTLRRRRIYIGLSNRRSLRRRSHYDK
jgi:hypothetical protein